MWGRSANSLAERLVGTGSEEHTAAVKGHLTIVVLLVASDEVGMEENLGLGGSRELSACFLVEAEHKAKVTCSLSSTLGRTNNQAKAQSCSAWGIAMEASMQRK